MAEYTMKQYKDKIDRWIKDYPKEAEKTLKTAAEIVYGEVQKSHLSGPKMGVGEGSETHGTLQPRSGNLRSSITTKVNREGNKMEAAVGTFKRTLPYARIHEYGGIIGRRKMPERSYLRSSLKAKKRTILRMILDAIKRSYNNV